MYLTAPQKKADLCSIYKDAITNISDKFCFYLTLCRRRYLAVCTVISFKFLASIPILTIVVIF